MGEEAALLGPGVQHDPDRRDRDQRRAVL
jgi:hypothetical protein